MTLPCPNCGARLRVIVDDPELQEWYESCAAKKSFLRSLEDALEMYRAPKEEYPRIIQLSPECPCCHGLLHLCTTSSAASLAHKANRDVQTALVLAPDAQPEREGVA